MTEEKSFPYLQLFGIVLASLCVTVILFWVWHMVEMRTMRSADKKVNDTVRKEILLLKEYSSTTPKSTSVKN